MKKLFIFLIVIFAVANTSIFTFAQTQSESDFLKQETKEIEESLDDKTEKILSEYGATLYDASWTQNLTYKNIFSHCLDFLKSGGNKPFRSAISALGILLLCSLMQSLSPELSVSKSINYTSLAVFSVICAPALYSLITACISLLKSVSVFMTALVPLITALLSASGKPLAAASSSVSLSMALSVLSLVTSFFVLPVMSGYLAFGVCAGFTGNKGLTQLAISIKKIVNWTFSLAVTIFLAVFSAKNSITSAQDSLSVKTAKFVLGSTVPITGGILSETLSSVAASLSLIKKTAAIYAALALLIMFLPPILEILCWRFCFLGIKTVGALFKVEGFTEICEIFDNMLSMLLAVLLLVPALFVIMLGIAVNV